MSVTAGRIVVIGVGNEFRHDDGAGPEVVSRLRGRIPDEVALAVSDGEPTRLLEEWTGTELAVVVDAVAGSGAASGRLHRLVVSEAGPVPAEPESGAPDISAGDSSRSSSHDLGLGQAIGLARALGRMPGMLIVHAIEATDFSQGRGLSPAVAAAIDELTAAVLLDVCQLPG